MGAAQGKGDTLKTERLRRRVAGIGGGVCLGTPSQSLSSIRPSAVKRPLTESERGRLPPADPDWE